MEKLLLVWKEPVERKRYVIGELLYDSSQYIFRYLKDELPEVLSKGFDFFPGFNDLDKEYFSSSIFANISTRLPNPARPDYLDILNLYGLSLIDDEFSILARTKGKLLTDNFEFIKEFLYDKSKFDVAGTRYYINDELKSVLKVNDKLYLEKDYENSKDKYAVKVIYKSKLGENILGYVPRYYSKNVYEMLDNNIKYSAMIEGLNLEIPLSGEEVAISVKLIFDRDK